MPQIKIISPTDNQTILGDKVTISFIVGDLEVGREGHLHLWLDNPIQEASTAAEITSNLNYSLTDMSSGYHNLAIEVVKPDHLSYHPVTKQTVSFITSLPEILTVTSVPESQNILPSGNLFSWQNILLITSTVIISAGLIIKYIWGRPQIWR